MGGAIGHADKKPPEDEMASSADSNGRPLWAGEYLQSLVGKCLLQTEMVAMSPHLGCNQLAVGVRAGAEMMPHLAREWLQIHADDRDRVLVDSDKGNTHNEVDRHTFLRRAREVTPGACRWLEYIYPTHTATCIFYRGRVIDSSAGGHHGCP